MKKYDPVIWATIDDALKAQEIYARGGEPKTLANEEGYLVVVGAVYRALGRVA